MVQYKLRLLLDIYLNYSSVVFKWGSPLLEKVSQISRKLLDHDKKHDAF